MISWLRNGDAFAPTRSFSIIVIVLINFVLLIPSLQASTSSVKVGAEVLNDRGYNDLFGKHIGLVTNHTAAVGEKQSVCTEYTFMALTKL